MDWFSLTSTPERTIFLLLRGVHCIQTTALWDQWKKLVSWFSVHVGLPDWTPLTQHYMVTGQEIPENSTNTNINKGMDKNETHCHNDWNQWMYPIHIKRAYSNLRCMDTWEWAATWHLHSSGTVESGRGSTIPYRAATHRDEYWSFPNQWPRMKQKLIYRLEN